MAITALSFIAAYYIRAGISTLPGLFSFSYYAWMLMIILFLWGFLFFSFGVYDFLKTRSLGSVSLAILKGLVMGGLFLKEIFDRVSAFLLLLIFSPIFFAVALGIKIFSPGPVFFKQERSGLNGRKFIFYKFRSMVENAEEMQEKLKHLDETSGPVFKVQDDPRLTNDKWMEMDLEYIDNWSLWLDFKILIKTIPAILSRKGAW